jgi:hypothetical protein
LFEVREDLYIDRRITQAFSNTFFIFLLFLPLQGACTIFEGTWANGIENSNETDANIGEDSAPHIG